jgi:hypothetical protein
VRDELVAKKIPQATYDKIKDVPPEIKQRIKELLQVTVLSVNKVINLSFEPKGRTSVLVTCRTEWTIRNVSRAKQSYTPRLAILEADRPVFLSHQVISQHVNHSIDEQKAAQHVVTHKVQGVREFVGEDLELEPSDIGGDYRINWEYTVTQPREHHHVDGFRTATIGVTILISKPHDIDVAVIGDLKRVGNEWSTNRLFTYGEFVTTHHGILRTLTRSLRLREFVLNLALIAEHRHDLRF